ncbi:hypothetical protein [Aeromonas sp. 30P]|uniref:hypothetical protein n=1 Tax=Aeromonas sp. 30P TaxID=3452717 RepID=UPI003F7A6403
MHGYITLSQEGIKIVSGEQTKDDPMILMTRQSLLITLCTLLMISLFTPHLPQSTEQWLTTLLLGLLVTVALLLVRLSPLYDGVVTPPERLYRPLAAIRSVALRSCRNHTKPKNKRSLMAALLFLAGQPLEEITPDGIESPCRESP